MALSYTSYYGSQGEHLKAYNIAEPFTINDITTTRGEDEVVKIESWFNDSWENIFKELIEFPNTLPVLIGNTLNSSVQLISGDIMVDLNIIASSRNSTGNIIGYAQPDVSRTAVYHYINDDNVMVSSARIRISADNTNTTVSDQVIAGYVEYNKPITDWGNQLRQGVPVLVRDYIGNVFILKIEPRNNGMRGDAFGWIKLNAIDRFPSFMDFDFWDNLPNNVPPPERGEGIVDINNRFSPRVGMSGLGIYPMTEEMVTAFAMDLWTENLFEKLIYRVNGDVMNSIVSLRWFYGIGGSIPRVERQTYLTVGNVAFNGALPGTLELRVTPASSDIMTYTMGSVTVPRQYNNFLDFSPFTKLQLFIPYVGFVDLDMTEFAGKRLRLDYNINIVTGASIAYVYVSTGEGTWRIASEYATTLGVEIPLSIDARESISSRIATSVAGVGASGIGALAGGVAGPIGAVAGASAAPGMVQQSASGQLQSFSNTLTSVSGSLSGGSSRNGGGVDNETGSLGDFTPHIIITRPVTSAPSDYNMMVGKPDYRSGSVSSFSGYIKAGAIKNSGVGSVPRQAMDEIEQLLRSGVYTS